jgi:hypothetical protein
VANSFGKIADMLFVVDLDEDCIDKHILNTLLQDHTTGNNIIWATTDYEENGQGYQFSDSIEVAAITGPHKQMIRPRFEKGTERQKERSKDKAEVFTPAWVCNKQNNLIDREWFGREEVFNRETEKGWITIQDKIDFPEGKHWQDYVCENRLEITCGEAPYLVSRFDVTTGEKIPVRDRIGLLDRKLRIVSENTSSVRTKVNIRTWRRWALKAIMSTYGFEWQGDNLLLAREAILLTYAENYIEKWDVAPKREALIKIAEVISWNLWQMDGLTYGIPGVNPEEIINEKERLFSVPLEDRLKRLCRIKEWTGLEPIQGNEVIFKSLLTK